VPRITGSDSDLDAMLSKELHSYNVAASGIDDQQEFEHPPEVWRHGL